jgi:hypothetical protein
MQPDFVFKLTEDNTLILKNTGVGYDQFLFTVVGPGEEYDPEDSGSGSGSGSGTGSGSGSGFGTSPAPGWGIVIE